MSSIRDVGFTPGPYPANEATISFVSDIDAGPDGSIYFTEEERLRSLS